MGGEFFRAVLAKRVGYCDVAPLAWMLRQKGAYRVRWKAAKRAAKACDAPQVQVARWLRAQRRTERRLKALQEQLRQGPGPGQGQRDEQVVGGRRQEASEDDLMAVVWEEVAELQALRVRGDDEGVEALLRRVKAWRTG